MSCTCDCRHGVEDLSIEPRYVSGTVRYQLEDVTWRHAFQAHLLDDEELAAQLEDAGLELVRTLDDAGRWVAARLNWHA